MSRVVLLALLVLGGCSRSSGGNPAEEACARQADDSPAMRDLLAKSAGTLNYQWQNADAVQRARQDAMLACLRARGLAPKGGVERPRSS